MKLVISFFLVLSSLQLLAQERYLVVYDYKDETKTYYHLNKNNSIDDTLSKPRFKRNSLIEIKLKNVNPFAVDVVTKLKEEDIHNTTSNFNFGSLLGSIGNLTTAGIGGLSPNIIIGENGSQNQARGGLKMTDEDPSSYLAQFNNDVVEVAALKNRMAADLTNPNLSKEEIQNNIKKFISQEVATEDSDDNLTMFLGKRLNKIVAEQKIISRSLTSTAPLSAVSRGGIQMDEENNAIDYDEVQKILSALSKSLSETKTNINQIQNLYNLLAASSFEKTFDYQLEADKADFEMKFVQSALAADVTEPSTLKTRNIKMFARGGFKINSSIGLTLNSFGNISMDFYIDPDTNVIRADTNNYFVPNLATMINFYPMITENFNLGGTFGLSIPISGELRGVNILFGPSIFMGNNNRLSISGGVVYGPVKKLVQGQELGKETYQTDLSNYIQNVYKTGYFLGISFSIFDINQ